jgi:hypothetical protein
MDVHNYIHFHKQGKNKKYTYRVSQCQCFLSISLTAIGGCSHNNDKGKSKEELHFGVSKMKDKNNFKMS